MSELYKRSLGYPFDEDALRREIENGNAVRYTATIEEPAFEGVSDLQFGIDDAVEQTRLEQLESEIIAWQAHEQLHSGLEPHERDEMVLLKAELVVEQYSIAISELAVAHPKYTAHVAKMLIARLDAMAAFGDPVDPEMYVDAHSLAEEIVAANPDKNAEELTVIVETMVAMIQADYRRRQLVLTS